MICMNCGSPLYHRHDDVGGSIAIDLLSLAAEVAHAPDLVTAQARGADMLAIGAAAMADENHEHPTVAQNGSSATQSERSAWRPPDPHWVDYRCSSCPAIQKGLVGHDGGECPSCGQGQLERVPDRQKEASPA